MFHALMSTAADAELPARSVGAHQCTRLHLAVAVIFSPTEGVFHPKNMLQGALLWLAGPSCRPGLHQFVARLAGSVQPGVVFTAPLGRKPPGSCA